jgi:threonine dehydrogenase-like Zn-dependent dehydrogenase
LTFPFKYGYAAVGCITALGPGADPEFLDRLVFAFQPHQTHFNASQDDVFLLPESVSAEKAPFLPNMETAVGFMLDGAPLIGERVAVFGQGVVGLLTTGLLARFPLGRLWTYDRYASRQRVSQAWGAQRSLDAPEGGENFDLVYELSGSTEALNAAIGASGFDGRIVLGSWYGKKPAALDLGGAFHRSRIRLLASQVSTIAPRHMGRWSRLRRFATAARFVSDLPVEGLITHRFPFENAAAAFSLLADRPHEALQVLLVYPAAPKDLDDQVQRRK